MEPLKVGRSYEKQVLERLFDAIKSFREVSFVSIGKSGEYPLFCVTIGSHLNPNLKDVLISAGIHGEEPAGIFALLRFLEKDIADFLDDFRFTIFPCINPFGFERGYRFNEEGLDINREFGKETLCVEANKVTEHLKLRNRQFVCTIDLHETDPNDARKDFVEEANPTEFYMWEVCPDKNLRVGDRVIEKIERFIPVCKWETIYEDKNNGGVIWYPEGCGNQIYAERTTLEGFLADNYTPQSFTLETPCGWQMAGRIFAHRTALKSILELKRHQNSRACPLN